MEINIVKFVRPVVIFFALFAVWHLWADVLLPRVFEGSEHIEPEKVTCTVLNASHDFVGWLGCEKFSVVVEAGGELYEIHDRDTYYLYCDKIGQSFPAERSGSIAFGKNVVKWRVYLSGDYGADWKVNSLLHKQQNKEVSKKCQLS